MRLLTDRRLTPLGSPVASGLAMASRAASGAIEATELQPIDGGLTDKPMAMAGTWWTRWG